LNARSEEAIRTHWPALGKGILINSGTGVRRPMYTVGVRETQNGIPVNILDPIEVTWMSLQLTVEGTNILDVADLKKLLAAQGVAIDAISSFSEPSVGKNSLGETGSGQLLIDVAKIGHQYLPVVLGILATWLMKSRSHRQKKAFALSIQRGQLTLKRFTSTEAAEQGTAESVEKELLEVIKAS